MDSDGWKQVIDKLDFAFQPIVNIHTGVCFGYEALLRGYEGAGFSSIQEFLDSAYHEEVLFGVDLRLREKAIEKFTEIRNAQKAKVFFNLDNRVLLMPDYFPGNTSRILSKFDLHPDSICFEISERHELFCSATAQKVLDQYKQQAYRIAIDDFGTGFSGLQLLYHSEPDFIKVDRFFIAGIETDSRKKLFVSKVLNLAHILGITVIAEGVETENEYYCCSEIGCDFVQGYFVQRPTTDVTELMARYENIATLDRKDRRTKSLDHRLLLDQMEYYEPVHLYDGDKGRFTHMSVIFEAFRTNKTNTFFPVINGGEEPIGLIREKELKEYVYSKWGKDLLMNKAWGKTLVDFVVKCPVSEISTKIERILELYTMDEKSEGIVLTENGKYIGFLSTRSLLKVINDKNLAVAREQNPLSKLPGNTMINEYIERAIEDAGSTNVFAYFDFDNFKPFNDGYGFRQGDRAILLFADILKKASNVTRFFAGHVGGDDFFAGFKADHTDQLPALHGRIKEIVDRFAGHAVSLYNREDRERGYMTGTDREGNERQFPLLTVSAAVVTIPNKPGSISLEEIGSAIAELKKIAKKSTDRIAFRSMCGRETLRTAGTLLPFKTANP